MIGALALVLVLGIAYYLNPGPKPAAQECARRPFESYSGKVDQLPIDDNPFNVAYAQSSEEMSRGLGGIECLSTSDAMLFVYTQPEISSFWMKDMRISIDIIWLDANGSVITIAGNVSPETFPKSFTPEAPATYVLETKAGTAEVNGWGKGTSLIDPSRIRQ